MRKLILASSVFLAGAATGGYSPIGCGCLDMNALVASQIGVGSPSDLEDPMLVREALRRRFETNGIELTPFERRNCTDAPDGVIVCRYWLWRKPGFIKSLDITIWVGPHISYKSAAVSYGEQSTSPPDGT